MKFIIGIYLFFIFASLYSLFLVLLIFFRNREEFYPKKEFVKYYDISVVIPAYNEEEGIADTIKALENLDYPQDKLEIIVVDDGSTDRTVEIVKGLNNPHITLLSKQNEGKAAHAKNYGINFAKGEIITIIDADSFPEPDSFKKMIAYFEDPNIAAVTATCIPRNRKKLIEKMQTIEYFLIAFGRKILDFIDSVYVTPGSLSMYRRDVIANLGNFDVHNITEDIEIAWNIMKGGYKNRMCLDAKVTTIVPSNLKAWWKQRLRWDIGGLQTIAKYKNSVFKKNQKMFGMFVTPRFILTHILSLSGFLVMVYVLGKNLAQYILSLFYTVQGGATLFEVPTLLLVPSVFTFYMAVLFIFGIGFTLYGLKTMRSNNLGFKPRLSLVLYLLLYLALYPLVLLHSIYALAVGDIKW